MGVMVEAGIVKEGTPLCVPSKDVSTTFFLLFFSQIFITHAKFNQYILLTLDKIKKNEIFERAVLSTTS